MAQSYDRHGHRLEPLKSALELHRERFAKRLERSTADRTRRQEEAWARLDRCPSPINEHPKRKRYYIILFSWKKNPGVNNSFYLPVNVWGTILEIRDFGEEFYGGAERHHKTLPQ